MFKRKHPHGDEAAQEPVPDLPVEGLEERTTCYPEDGQAPPPVVGQPRTTVYRQSAKWNRGGYDTVN